MRAEIRTPYIREAAAPAGGGLWRKKLLPVGKVNYKGRVLDFDRPYLEDLAQAFSSGAYGQVPFQLADGDNKHTNDPERFRGEVVKVDVRPDGLWITAQTTPDGNKLLMTNPKLGVSARIIEDYDRSDGSYYPKAIQHVLGTLDPRIPGLGSWERVEMSNEHVDMIVDLSEASFAGEEGGTMPDLNGEQQARLAKLLDLDPDKLDALIAAQGDGGGGGQPAPSAGDEPDLSEDELVDIINGMSDEEFAALQDEFDLETGAADGEGALAGAALSSQYPDALELANIQLADQQRQLDDITKKMDKERWQSEKRRLMGAGLTPAICDMARPLLEGSGKVVEMANGGNVDAGQVMRAVLNEVTRTVSMLDLSGELGTAMDAPDDSTTADTARQEFVKHYKSMTGLS